MDLGSNQQVALGLMWTDDVGHTYITNPVPGDVAVWTLGGEDVITLDVEDDGNSATAIAKGQDGTAQVTVSSNNNQGGTVTASLTIVVTVGKAMIVSVQIVPEEKTNQ